MPSRPKILGSDGKARAEQYDARRGSARARGYDSTWDRLSQQIRRQEPLCRRCRDRGYTTLAVLVDHVKPLREGGARLEPANLMPLCARCHSIKTMQDQRRVKGEGGDR